MHNAMHLHLFFRVPGMFEVDLCRAVYLVFHGGYYYFDVDIVVVRATIAIVSYDEIDFQAFQAAARRRSAIVRIRSLRMMPEML